MHIAILDAYAINPGDLSWEPLERFGSLSVYDRTDVDQLAERVAKADIVLSSKIPWDAAAFDLAPRLRFLASMSTGYNIIDLEEAGKRGIVVSNVPAYSTPDVAQMTFALILELCLHVGAHAKGVQEGKWAESKDFCYWDYPLIELSGKTIGIIGMGSIGQAVARIANAFDMDVLFNNRSSKPELEHAGCRQATFDEILQSSDFISLHCPETPETRGMIDAEALAKMKEGAFLINTARGTLIVEPDLAHALNSGKLGGAGLDVLATEPMTTENPLFKAKNCLITPHIAWATYEARARLVETLILNVEAFVAGTPQNLIGFMPSSNHADRGEASSQ